MSDKVLFAGNDDLEKIENLIFPVVKILRDESKGTFEFGYEDDIVVISSDKEQFRIPILKFREQASLLLFKLKDASSRSFSVPEIEQFINSFHCHTLKASSSVKSDIRIVIHDHRTGANAELGFSIKSQLGGASTLLNAGATTNFIFKVVGIETREIEIVNEIGGRSKIKDRIKTIEKKGRLDFIKTESAVFGNNLSLIDSSLPRIVAEMLHEFFSTSVSKTAELVEEITKSNPLNYDLKTEHPFYSYKIKRLLTDIALGMVPSKVWTGELDATGGYLVVKEDGEILCYHIYNRNEFEDYLINNTKFDTASSKSHGFWKLYEDGGNIYFKLNLQIRFLK